MPGIEGTGFRTPAALHDEERVDEVARAGGRSRAPCAGAPRCGAVAGDGGWERTCRFAPFYRGERTPRYSTPPMPTGFSWSEIGVDPARVRVIRDAALPSRGEYVLYWCMVNQRVPHNHALQAAIALGNRLGLPVVCYHALRPDYPHASDRLHAFVLQGLDELGAAMRARGVPYWLELPRTATPARPAAGGAREAGGGRRLRLVPRVHHPWPPARGSEGARGPPRGARRLLRRPDAAHPGEAGGGVRSPAEAAEAVAGVSGIAPRRPRAGPCPGRTGGRPRASPRNPRRDGSWASSTASTSTTRSHRSRGAPGAGPPRSTPSGCSSASRSPGSRRRGTSPGSTGSPASRRRCTSGCSSPVRSPRPASRRTAPSSRG